MMTTVLMFDELIYYFVILFRAKNDEIRDNLHNQIEISLSIIKSERTVL